MSDLRFALAGAGFWARYQLAGWREVGGTRCVAVYNRTRERADALAREFCIPRVYDDAEELLGEESLDFIDIVTDVGTHPRFVHLAAAHHLPVICQKPMAPSLAEAAQMVAAAHTASTPFFVHENWRWQTPIRELKKILESGQIGTPFRARLQFSTGFPVFDNQPFLRETPQFILTDIGSHVLDTARMLFGEMSSLYCRTAKVHADIKGEDVATVMLGSCSGMTVTAEMAYAGNYLEHDRFPETYALVEGDHGSIELGPDYWLRVTTKDGTTSHRCKPPRYAWADPAYDVVHASIVPCCADLLGALCGDHAAETTGDDNLKTVRLVFAAYQSARDNAVITL